MSGIWKINMVQNLTTKQDFNKLSFKKGDSFVARVLKLDGNTSEVILKLLDGRTFPAKIEGAVNGPLDNYLLKFVVDSFQDGKLNIKILEKNLQERILNDQQKEENLLKDFAGRVNFPLEKDDVNILKAMLKFNIPVNESNFKEIKSLTDFISKINLRPEEEDLFIEKFLNSKGIEPQSLKGETIKSTLRGFFNEIKKFDLNGILMLKESNITLSEENMKSFNKIISANVNVFEDVKQIKELLAGFNEDNKSINNKQIITNEVAEEFLTPSKNKINEEDIKVSTDGKRPLKVEEANKKNLIDKDILTNHEGVSDKEKTLAMSSLLDKDDQLNLKIKESFNKIEDSTMLSTEKLVKDEIKDKLGILKNTLLDILKFSEENSSTANKVFQNLEGKFQEFKMFNTLNNDYYYLNIPMNIKQDNYDCKLIIKDERANGKKLDSKNIKIATSISTINMDVVDAYITVLNNNVSISIEAEDSFVKILDMLKTKLLKDLSNSTYNFSVIVEGKKKEFSLLNCREFFSDEEFTAINIVV